MKSVQILLLFLPLCVLTAQDVPFGMGKAQFFSNAGAPLSGGQLFSYACGTSTPQTTYANSGGSSANTNPVILDSSGRATIYLAPLCYKFSLQDAQNNTLWTFDNYLPWNVLPTITNLSLSTLTVTSTLTMPGGWSCNVTGCAGAQFSSAATFSGGLITPQGTNSSIFIGTGGNFYTRSFSGGDAGCGGIADGWLGVRTDTKQLEFCASSTTVIAPGLAANQTWTGAQTFSAAVTFSSTSSFSAAAAFNGGAVTCTNANGNTLLSGCNAAFATGPQGNLYTRTFTGDAACGGVPDGWIGVRTDTAKIEICIGGVMKSVGLT